MATRKDYEFTARIIAGALRAPMSDAERWRIESLAADFASGFASQSGSFDRGRFARACCVTTESERAIYAGNRPAQPQSQPAPEAPARTRKPSARASILDAETARGALETGAGWIGYWARIVASTPERLTFYDAERESERERFYSLDAADIQRAADRVLRERLAADDILAAIVTRDIDAIAADVLIQVASFGEIVYS